MLTPKEQEAIAYLLVGIAAASLLRGFYRKHLADPLSRWLLQRGKVKLAMRVRGRRKPGCH